MKVELKLTSSFFVLFLCPLPFVIPGLATVYVKCAEMLIYSAFSSFPI